MVAIVLGKLYQECKLPGDSCVGEWLEDWVGEVGGWFVYWFEE